MHRPPPIRKHQGQPEPRRATSWPRAPCYVSHRPACGLRRLWHHRSQYPNQALGGRATLRLQGHGHCAAQGQGAGHHGSASQPMGRRDMGEPDTGVSILQAGSQHRALVFQRRFPKQKQG